MNKVIALLLVLIITSSIFADSNSPACNSDTSRTPVACRPCIVLQLFASLPLNPFAGSLMNLDSSSSGAWAVLCDECGQGDKQSQCVKCGQPGARIQAMLCPQCSAQNPSCCIKCGKSGAHIPARLCDQCGFGEKKNECVKCGKIQR